MSNPNENNNPVANKQKAGKEFAQENETSQKQNINAESFISGETKPTSVNTQGANESFAVANETKKDTSASAADWAHVKSEEDAILLAKELYGDNPKIKRPASVASPGSKKQPKPTRSTPNDPFGVNMVASKVDNATQNNSSGANMGNPKLDNATQNNSSGANMGNPKLDNATQNNSSGADMKSPSENHVPKAPEGDMPKIESAPASEVTEEGAKETTETDGKKQAAASGDQPEGSGDPNPSKKAPKKEKEIFVSGALKEALASIAADSSTEDKKTPTENADEEGAKVVKEATDDLAAQKTLKDNPSNDSSTDMGNSSNTTNAPTTTQTEEAKAAEDKKKADAEALGAFDLKETAETEAEAKEDAIVDENKNKGKQQGLIVGRSMGYGARIEPEAGGEGGVSITKFAEGDDPTAEEAAKLKYNKDSEIMARNMEKFGYEKSPEGNQVANPMKGYYDAYIQGYNEGHREGVALKAEAAGAERTANMKKEQGTQEYRVGASLGMTCGILTAKKEKEVDTKFSMTKEGETKEISVKTTVANLDSAAFDKQQTPGGELSGPAYKKAFLLHYNMGYKQAEQQRSQPPPMDDDYKLGYKQGYKLGSQKGNGEKGDKDLLAIETTLDAKDQQTLKKEELQEYRGFYAGYNKGYTQVQKAKKSKAQTEREAKYKNPNFVAGYSTGNLKGFLTAMIEPSGIDLLAALNDPKKMEAAGVPSFFPIPDSLRKSIKDTLIYGEVADNAKESNPGKALLGKPLFKEGLLMGYNQGYLQGQNSRGSFRRDKHKMHPDYQRSTLVLMSSSDSPYKGPTEEGGIVQGFSMGQILANAKFEYNQLIVKEGRTAKEEKRFADLAKAMAALNGVINKENKYYKLGIDEFFNWWMEILAKKAQKKKSDEGYSGGKGSVKREGFEWGRQIGDKVISVKEQLKGIKRRGHDITARSQQLNATIKSSDSKAKTTSKNKGGEDYFIGYRNGYNHSFRVAKKAKKSDKGNLDTDDLLENAGEQGSQHIRPIHALLGTLGLDSDITQSQFATAIQDAKSKFGKESEKAFKDGLSDGYNSGYSAKVIDVETGEASTEKKDHSVKVKEKYDKYKGLKDDDAKTKYQGNVSFGVFYFFLLGYQLDKEDKLEEKYGLPKGISDAYSFNLGYKTGEADSENGKTTDKSGEANSKDAYKEGYYAAKQRAQYAGFKKQMILAAIGKKTTNETEVSNAKEQTEGASNVKDGGSNGNGNSPEETGGSGDAKGKIGSSSPSNSSAPIAESRGVDPEMTGGLSLLADDKMRAVGKEGEVDQGTQNLQNDFYQKGNKAAAAPWMKIIYLRKGVPLSDKALPQVCALNFVGEKKPIVITDDVQAASKHYMKKDALIEELAENYIAATFTWKKFVNVFSGGFSSWPDAWKGYTAKREEEKQSYIRGYAAKIQSIEDDYIEESSSKWLYNSGYYNGIKEVAPDTEIAKPSGPYADMSGELDTSSSLYKNGLLEGLKMGALIKNGIVQPTASQLAEASGSNSSRGFANGKKEGAKEGGLAAKNPSEKLPTEEDRAKALRKELAEIYTKEQGGVNDGMNGDYEDAYVKAYFTSYWENRDYEYGRLLGYDRGAAGGDAMFESDPEEGVVIKDENAFFIGFNKGRDMAVMGLSKDALQEGQGPETPIKVIKKIASEYAQRNAAIAAIHDLKIKNKTIRKIAYSNDSFYKRYAKLKTIEWLGLADRNSGDMLELLISYDIEGPAAISEYLTKGFKDNLQLSFSELSSKDRSLYLEAFKTNYDEAYLLAHAQGISELTAVAMTASMDKRKDVDSGSMGAGMDSGLDQSGDTALDVLKDLLFGGTKDFYLDDLLLLKMFYALETKIEKVQYYIEEDLEDIQFNRSVSELLHGNDHKAELEEIAILESELEDENLTKRKRTLKTKRLESLKEQIEEHQADKKQTQKEWEAAEEAAKEKIDSIRVLMKDSLAFDAPLESNDDILTYIKINLESSKGNKESVYDDIDIFNDLALQGAFSYKESAGIETSISGDADFYLDHYAENVYIEESSVLMKKNGFEFASKGLWYIKEDMVTFMEGSLVTPSIEGGAHMGEQYKYNFDEFTVHLGQGVKSQIDAQKYRLKGGSM